MNDERRRWLLLAYYAMNDAATIKLTVLFLFILKKKEERQVWWSIILNIIFKPFVTRLIMMKEYLMSSENVALYGECRAFLTCIKENHGDRKSVV